MSHLDGKRLLQNNNGRFIPIELKARFSPVQLSSTRENGMEMMAGERRIFGKIRV